MKLPNYIYPDKSCEPFQFTPNEVNASSTAEFFYGAFRTKDKWLRIAQIDLKVQSTSAPTIRFFGSNFQGCQNFRFQGRSGKNMGVTVFLIIPPLTYVRVYQNGAFSQLTKLRALGWYFEK